jgi:hypothetical protein
MRSSLAGKAALTILLIIILFQACLPGAYAQQQGPVLFHGIILDASTRQPLPDAHYVVRGGSAGAADGRGMFSVYAFRNDTITFSCIGYRQFSMTVHDTLRAREYTAGVYLTTDTTLIPAVIVIPRLGNIRAEIMADKPVPNQEIINATNNLRMAVYQGLTNPPELGDPATNYELLRQRMRMEAYEKGQIPSSQMVGLSPLTLIPLIYLLANGPPEIPDPPAPHISARDMEYLRQLNDSLLIRK